MSDLTVLQQADEEEKTKTTFLKKFEALKNEAWTRANNGWVVTPIFAKSMQELHDLLTTASKAIEPETPLTPPVFPPPSELRHD
jgi:hypothetical protein